MQAAAPAAQHQEDACLGVASVLMPACGCESLCEQNPGSDANISGGCPTCGCLCRAPDLTLDVRLRLNQAVKMMHPASIPHPVLESAKRRREQDTEDELSAASVERCCSSQCLPSANASAAIPLHPSDKSLASSQQLQRLAASWPPRTYATLHIHPSTFGGPAAVAGPGSHAGGSQHDRRRARSSGNGSSSSSGAWAAVAHVAYDIQPAECGFTPQLPYVISSAVEAAPLEPPATARSNAVQSNAANSFGRSLTSCGFAAGASGSLCFSRGGGSGSFDPTAPVAGGLLDGGVDPRSVVHGMPVSVAVAAAAHAYHATMAAALDSSIGTCSWGVGGAVLHHQWPVHTPSPPQQQLALTSAMHATSGGGTEQSSEGEQQQEGHGTMESSGQPTTSQGGPSVQQGGTLQQQQEQEGTEQFAGMRMDSDEDASPGARQAALPLSQAWHDSVADEAARLKVAKAVIQVLEVSGVGRALLGERMLPAVRRIELLLYRAAASRDEYLDPSTMMPRIMQLVRLQRAKLHAHRHGSSGGGGASGSGPPPPPPLLRPAASSAAVCSLAGGSAASAVAAAAGGAGVAAEAAAAPLSTVSAFAAAAAQVQEELLEVAA